MRAIIGWINFKFCESTSFTSLSTHRSSIPPPHLSWS